MQIDISTSPRAYEYPIPRIPYVEERRVASSPSVQWGGQLNILQLGTTPQSNRQIKNLVILSNGQEVTINLVKSTSSNSYAVALSERLNQVKSRLDLSITQMAELFGVTRKSVYDWYEGVEPRQIKTSRMETLIDVLMETSTNADLKRLKAVWNISISGHSFREIFNDDKLDANSLKSNLIAILHELSPRMAKSTNSVHKTAAQLGSAHLVDIDRSADFS